MVCCVSRTYVYTIASLMVFFLCSSTFMIQDLESIYCFLSLTPALVQKHHRIILNYYLRYMSGFDAQLMRNVVMVSKRVMHTQYTLY